MIAIEFEQLLKYYENSKEISSDKVERGPRFSDDNQQRFFINLGHNKGLNKGGLLRLICSNTNLPSKSVGALDIYNDFSFFELDKTLSDKILEDLQGKEYDGKSFVVEIASPNGAKKRGRDRNRARDRNRGRDRNRRRR